MFERYTDRARRVIVLAQEQARIDGTEEIFTYQLLLALAKEGEGVAAKALELLDLDPEVLEEKIKWLAPAGKVRTQSTGFLPFATYSKTVLEEALREALKLGHNYIGTEHILLALDKFVQSDDGAGTITQDVLNGLPVRQTVIQLLSGYQQQVPVPDEQKDEKYSTAVLVRFGESNELIIEGEDYDTVVDRVQDELEAGKLSFDQPPAVIEVRVLRVTNFNVSINEVTP